MKVHILVRGWDTRDGEGYKVIRPYLDINVARAEMRKLASETKDRIDEEMGEPPWDDNFALETDNFIGFGWHDDLGMDWLWSWTIETMEVQ